MHNLRAASTPDFVLPYSHLYNHIHYAADG